MTNPAPSRSGSTQRCAGLDLAVDDFVKHDGTWYRLVEQIYESRGGVRNLVRSRVFRGVTKDHGRRALLLDSTIVTAYRWDR